MSASLGSRLSFALRCACDTARLMVGVGDYDAYRLHALAAHPDREPMSRAEWFRDRQDARFGAKGGGGFRCC